MVLRPLVWRCLKEQGLVKETGHTCRGKFALVSRLSGGSPSCGVRLMHPQRGDYCLPKLTVERHTGEEVSW